MEFVRCFILQGRAQYILTAFRFVLPEQQDSSTRIFFGIALDHETHWSGKKLKLHNGHGFSKE